MISIQDITTNWNSWLNESIEPNPQIDSLRRQISSIKLKKEKLRTEQAELKEKIQKFNEEERRVRERIKQLQRVSPINDECGEGNKNFDDMGRFSSPGDAESQSQYYSCNTPRTNKTGGSIPCGNECGRSAREAGSDIACKNCLEKERARAKTA